MTKSRAIPVTAPPGERKAVGPSRRGHQPSLNPPGPGLAHRAAIGELSLPNAAEDGIELGIADVEGVVVALELLEVVEEECERVVDTYRREMVAFRRFEVSETDDPRGANRRRDAGQKNFFQRS
jgi:hypothetical protein